MVQFVSGDAQEWRDALDAYQERLEGLENEKLVELDAFYRVELPKVVAKRHPEAYVTRNELMKIMDWKLSRGKWRCIILTSQSSAFSKVLRKSRVITQINKG